jgi:uncharacterized protein YhhL (DUF1145 family)
MTKGKKQINSKLQITKFKTISSRSFQERQERLDILIFGICPLFGV